MNRVRNAVIIIILCIIGLSSWKAGHKKPLALAVPPADDMRDAVAGGPSHATDHKKPLHGPTLGLPNMADDNLRDAVAEGPAIPTGLRNRLTPHGNTEDETPPPPRGGEHPGIGPLGGPNPGSQLPPPGPLSPSGPVGQNPD